MKSPGWNFESVLDAHAQSAHEPPLIVTLVKRQGAYQYYLSERDFWILDDRRWAADEQGLENYDCSHRFGIPVVTEETSVQFLKEMSRFELSLSLIGYFYQQQLTHRDRNAALAYIPVLFVDFDLRRLLTIYDEFTMFEHYVPPGWVGEDRAFFGSVPKNLQYWVVAGTDTTTVDYWEAIESLPHDRRR